MCAFNHAAVPQKKKHIVYRHGFDQYFAMKTRKMDLWNPCFQIDLLKIPSRQISFYGPEGILL